MQRARPRIFLRSFCRSSTGGEVGTAVGMGSVKIPVFIMRLSVLIILSSPVVSAIGQIEGLIDQWKIRHNVAEKGVFEEGPILPRRIVRVATTDGSVWATFECDYNRSAPALDQAKSKLVRFNG